MKEYNIRKAHIDDLDLVADLEAACFPASEAATKESFKARLEKYPNYFFLLFVSDKLVWNRSRRRSPDPFLWIRAWCTEDHHLVLQ